MKKILLIFSITVFLFILTGCAEEKVLNNGAIQEIDTIPDEFKNIAGTYNITFLAQK